MLCLFMPCSASALWANQENIRSIYFILIMIEQEENLITVSSLDLPSNVLNEKINNQNPIALGSFISLV